MHDILRVAAALAAFAAPAAFVAGGEACEDAPAPARAAGTACTTSNDCPNHGLCSGGVCAPCDFGLPPPNTACVPKCGNELGVGQPCSQGGGECGDFDLTKGEAGFCTVDFYPPSPFHVCTKPCSTDADCGTDGVCAGGGGYHGCLPAACLAPVDAGPAPSSP